MKKDLFCKSREIFGDLIKNPKFKERIKIIRKKYQIPLTGFKSISKYLSWDNEQKVEIKKIKREKVTLDVNDKPTSEVSYYERIIKIYSLDVFTLLKDYCLGTDWWSYIDKYICFGSFDKKCAIHKTVLIKESCGETPIEETIFLSFDSSTGHKQMFNRWDGETLWNNAVVPLQSLMQGYKRKNERPARKSRIGKKIKSMIRKDQSLTDDEIYNRLDPEKDKDIGFEYIRKIRSRLNKE